MHESIEVDWWEKIIRIINMPIAAVHELITNTVTVKVTSRATIVCISAYSKIQAVQLQRLREAINTYKQCKRTNVFNKLWYREASLGHMIRIHSKHIINLQNRSLWWLRRAETYEMSFCAFSPHFLWYCAIRTRSRKQEIIGSSRGGRICSSWIHHFFPPEWEVTKGWQMLEWMEVSDPGELHR